MYVYKRMNIGTAKPTAEEMQGIVHHMIDVAEPEEDFSVSKYCDMASPIVDDIVARGKTAIIAGGTGLYMDSLIKGNDFADFPDTGIRAKLEAKAAEAGFEAMREELRAVDPESADRLKDTRRIIRALEVYYETGALSVLWKFTMRPASPSRSTTAAPGKSHPGTNRFGSVWTLPNAASCTAASISGWTSCWKWD